MRYAFLAASLAGYLVCGLGIVHTSAGGANAENLWTFAAASGVIVSGLGLIGAFVCWMEDR